MFITFEGGEGVGKSTQIELLRQYFYQQGKLVITTREPGGTAFANKLRTIMLEQELHDPLTEYSLIATARRDHILNLIKPKLDDGYIVLCDRFFDSSIVYQGIVKGLAVNKMNQLHDIINENFLPELTILLDMEAEHAQQRVFSRQEKMNHYDAKNSDFHKKIREGFLQLASLSPHRIKIISADGEPHTVHQNIVNSLEL